KAIEDFGEGRIVGVGAGVTEASGQIQALEIVALETHLFGGEVIAQLARASVAEEPVARGIGQPAGQQRSSAGLPGHRVEWQSQVDRNTAGKSKGGAGQTRVGVSLEVRKELVIVNGRLGDKTERHAKIKVVSGIERWLEELRFGSEMHCRKSSALVDHSRPAHFESDLADRKNTEVRIAHSTREQKLVG